MPERIYNLRLHRWTAVTIGCGVLLVSGLMFFAGALVGHWWAERPETTSATDDTANLGTIEGEPLVASPGAESDGVQGAGSAVNTPGQAATGGGAASNLGRAVAPPVSGPRLTGPDATGPRVTGPRISRSGVSGPRVSGPTVRAPTATGPRVGSPRRPTTATVAGLAGDGSGTGAGETGQDGQPVDSAPGAETTGAETGETTRRVSDLFAIQVGLFADTEEAMAEIEALTARGYAPYLVVVRAQERRTVVRSVRLGPYPDRRTAQEAAANFRLDEDRGAAVVREHEPPVAP